MKYLLAVAMPLLLLANLPSPVAFRFDDVALEAGLDQLTVYGGRKTNRYLLETTGCGAAFLDFDNDGWLDAFLVNGSRLEGFGRGEAPVSHLYRNNRRGAFIDVTSTAGVGRSGWGQAACVGDYDNNGYDDLFVTYWGQNVLYRNKGDGSFEEVTKGAGLQQDRRRWNAGCAFVDYDRDGDLDLFVANYIDFDPETTPTPDSGLCLYKGLRVACGPPGLSGGKNLLYRNSGKGTFTDVSDSSGIENANGTYGLGVLTIDYNDDGWTDIYVANDSNPSALYRNNKDGTFTDIGIMAGCAYSQDGKPQAGMGLSAADYNHDGTLDIFKTNFAEDSSNLYRNEGDGFFEESGFAAGIGINTRFLGWACGLVDFDQDGWVDIFQVNGHVYPEVNQLQSLSRYKQPKIVYRNRRDGRFEDVTKEVGGDVLIPRAGRGAAFGDYDNDGDLDVLVNNVNDRPSLFRTTVENGNHWISIRLAGVKSNRDGIGAKVRCRVGEMQLVDEVRSGGSYYSQNQFRVHFGLGKAARADEIEIHWPSGQIDRFENVPADQFFVAEEGGSLDKMRPDRGSGS
ncbi:MAG: CRTAC1 family protein [Acidobacteriota bacterium]